MQVNLEQNEVCFYSLPVQGILLDTYEVLIYDITGEQTFNVIVSNNTNCTILEADVFRDMECAPLTLSVKAINSYGYSTTNTSLFVNNSSTEDHVCSCLSKNRKFVRILTI